VDLVGVPVAETAPSGLTATGDPYAALPDCPLAVVWFGGVAYAVLPFGGPLRFDGAAWTPLPGTPSPDITLACVHGGALVFATPSGACWRYTGATWTALPSTGLDYTAVLLSIRGIMCAFGGMYGEGDAAACAIAAFNGATWSTTLTDDAGGEAVAVVPDGAEGFIVAASNCGDTQTGLYGLSSYFAWDGPGTATMTRTGGGGASRWAEAAALVDGVPHVLLAETFDEGIVHTVDRWTGTAWETVAGLGTLPLHAGLLPDGAGAVLWASTGAWGETFASSLSQYDGVAVAELVDLAPAAGTDDHIVFGWVDGATLTAVVENTADGYRLQDFAIARAIVVPAAASWTDGPDRFALSRFGRRAVPAPTAPTCEPDRFGLNPFSRRYATPLVVPHAPRAVVGLTATGDPYAALPDCPLAVVWFGGAVYAVLPFGGPLRFDGAAWTPLPGIPSPDITLACVHGGALVFATPSGACWRYTGATWTALPPTGLDYTAVLLSIRGIMCAFGSQYAGGTGTAAIRAYDGTVWETVVEDDRGGEVVAVVPDGGAGFVVACSNYGAVQTGLYGASSYFAWDGPESAEMARTGGGDGWGERWVESAALVDGVPHIVLVGVRGESLVHTVDRWTGAGWEPVAPFWGSRLRFGLVPDGAGAIAWNTTGALGLAFASSLWWYDGRGKTEIADLAPVAGADPRAVFAWVDGDVLRVVTESATGHRLQDYTLARDIVTEGPPGAVVEATATIALGRCGASASVVHGLTGEISPAASTVFARLRAPVVFVLDAARHPIAVLDGYELFEWVDHWREPDEWTLIIDAKVPGAKTLATGAFIAAVVPGGETKVGLIDDPGVSLTGTDGVEAIVVTGRCYGSMLGARNALAGTASGSGTDAWGLTSTWDGGQPGSPAGAMAYYVHRNAIAPAEAYRAVPDLAIGTLTATELQVRYNARFQPITEILLEICQYSGLGWSMRYDEDAGLFRFDVLGGRDMTGRVAFSPDYGTVAGIAFARRTRDARNLAWVAGQGEGALRDVRGYYDTARYPRGPPSGLALREMFVDARDIGPTSETTLKERGDQKLAEVAEEASVEFTLLTGGAYDYPRDFRTGDVVRADYPGWASTEARIVAVGQRWDADGRTVTVAVGSEPADVRKTILDLARRQDQQERKG